MITSTGSPLTLFISIPASRSATDGAQARNRACSVPRIFPDTTSTSARSTVSFMVIRLCRAFRRDLSLSPKFVAQIRRLESQLAAIGLTRGRYLSGDEREGSRSHSADFAKAIDDIKRIKRRERAERRKRSLQAEGNVGMLNPPQ